MSLQSNESGGAASRQSDRWRWKFEVGVRERSNFVSIGERYLAEAQYERHRLLVDVGEFLARQSHAQQARSLGMQGLATDIFLSKV